MPINKCQNTPIILNLFLRKSYLCPHWTFSATTDGPGETSAIKESPNIVNAFVIMFNFVFFPLDESSCNFVHKNYDLYLGFCLPASNLTQKSHKYD